MGWNQGCNKGLSALRDDYSRVDLTRTSKWQFRSPRVTHSIQSKLLGFQKSRQDQLARCRRKAMLRYVLPLALLAISLPALAGDSLTGKYLETRTCQVYTGPCFANAE